MRTVIYALDASRNMAIAYVFSLNSSVAYYLKRIVEATCLLLLRQIVPRECAMVLLHTFICRLLLLLRSTSGPFKLICGLSSGKPGLSFDFGMDITFVSFHVFGK